MSVHIKTRGGVGESIRRIDGQPKVLGQFEYASDLHRDNMLWGETLRSPHPHAWIRSIDVSAAQSSPGVRAVITGADVPGRKTFGLDVQDPPVLAFEKVRYMGEAVAVVAAEQREQAREALKRIAVAYEELPALSDPERALEADAPKLHGHGNNIIRTLKILHGDPDAKADVWVEGYYETGMQEQAPLGPDAGLALT